MRIMLAAAIALTLSACSVLRPGNPPGSYPGEEHSDGIGRDWKHWHG
jgi:hypothetical protein